MKKIVLAVSQALSLILLLQGCSVSAPNTVTTNALNPFFQQQVQENEQAIINIKNNKTEKINVSIEENNNKNITTVSSVQTNVSALTNDKFTWNLKSINADKKLLSFPDSNIIVAVLDTGVDSNHPELKDKLLPLIDVWNEVEGNDIYKNGSNQYNFNGKDGNGHGTHVTGIISKVLDLSGEKGIKILPIKIANYTGKTTPEVLVKAINYAVEKGAKVINISLGGSASEGTDKLESTINEAVSKGVVIVSATGNQSFRRGGMVKKVNIPAAYKSVISVASIDINDKVSDFSNGGSEVTISAPGGNDLEEQVYSTWPTYNTYENIISKSSGDHAFVSGTSAACPHVSAAAALILAQNPGFSSEEVKEKITSTATDIDQKGFDYSTGYGKLDLFNALAKK